MRENIFKLRKYGLSESVTKSVLKEIDNIYDLIIVAKQEALLRKTNRRTSLSKAIKVVKNNIEIIDQNFNVNPYSLLGFGISARGLDRLVTTYNILTLEQLNDMNVEDLGPSAPQIMKNTLIKIKDIIQSNESLKLSDLEIMKGIILYNFFKAKKIKLERTIDIADVVPDKYFDILDISICDMYNCLNELIKTGYIHQYEDTYYFPTNVLYESEFDQIQLELQEKTEGQKKQKQQKKIVMPLEDFLKTDFKDKDILKYRLDGKTLEEIGDIFGVSRERIRQRQQRVLAAMPNIYEVGKYKEIFEEYSFSSTEFNIVFGVETRVYEYLMLVLKKGKKDTGEYILKSDKIPGRQKEKYLEKHKYFLTRFGEFKRINKQEFVDEILYKYKDITFNSDEFLEVYNNEADKYSYLNLTVDNVRSIDSMIARSSFAISTLGRRFRYFDMSPTTEDVELLINIIKNLSDGPYSMIKLINDNKDLMDQFDIRDEYELHNFYKKREDLLNSKIKLSRSPEFIIGNINKKKFLRGYIAEFTEQPLSNYIDYLYSEYGFRKNTMLSYTSANFREYIDGDKIRYAEEYSIVRNNTDIMSLLGDSVYLKSEVIKEFNKIDLIFSNVLLSKLGYYVKGNIVFKKKYGSVSRALSSIIGVEDVWRRGETPLEQSSEMTGHLSNLERSRDLVVLDDNTYARMSFLERNKIDLSLIEDYVKSVYHFLSKSTYFTLHSLATEGFEHPLIDLGFEPIFYERLISTSELFNPVNRSSPILFAKGIPSPVTRSKFFNYELSNYDTGIDIFDFRDSLKEKYNIEYDTYEIQYQCQQSGAYYSKEMEKIYNDKDKFLDEVYS